VRLQRNAGIGEGPGWTQAIHDRGRVVGTASGVKKTAFRLENLLCSSPSQGDQFSSNQTALRGVSSLKRLGHGAKVFAQPARLGGGQSKGIERFFQIESKQFCASRGRTERAAGASGMEAVF